MPRLRGAASTDAAARDRTRRAGGVAAHATASKGGTASAGAATAARAAEADADADADAGSVQAPPRAPAPAPEADTAEADRPGVYPDGTLVLVGCGKAKRNPEDPTDLHEAVVGPDEHIRGRWGPTGPAWRAADLYTSSYFAAKRAFAEAVTQWAGDPQYGWAILSAKHDLLYPWTPVTPYDTTVEDLGADPTDPEHRIDPPKKRRPDGREVVTEMDWWAARVAYGLASWVASFREPRDGRTVALRDNPNRANTLLVLAGQSYVEPLRERGVFEYGIARMAGDPNDLRYALSAQVNVRFPFEEVDAAGIGEQMAWLSDAVARLGGARDEGEQAEVGRWTGETRTCDVCDATPPEATLTAVAGGVYCADCHPEECARCGSWTRETGLGNYPLCGDCQTERGGQVNEPLDEPDGEQVTFSEVAHDP